YVDDDVEVSRRGAALSRFSLSPQTQGVAIFDAGRDDDPELPLPPNRPVAPAFPARAIYLISPPSTLVACLNPDQAGETRALDPLHLPRTVALGALPRSRPRRSTATAADRAELRPGDVYLLCLIRDDLLQVHLQVIGEVVSSTRPAGHPPATEELCDDI